MHMLGLVAGARRTEAGGGPGGSAFRSLLFSSDGLASPTLISANSTTTFIDVTGGQRLRTTNESRACLKITKAGTIRNLRVNVVTNTRVTTTNVYLRHNGANSALVAAVAAGSTGWKADDGLQSVVVAPGDLVCIGIVTGTGNGNFGQVMVQVEYEADEGLVTYFTLNMNETSENTSASALYAPVGGYGRLTIFGWASGPGHYGNTRSTIGSAATISNARINVITNTFDAAAVFTLMKNGAATGIVVTVGAGVTGEVLETSPTTITVADDDYLEWRCVSTDRTTGALGLGRMELTALSTGDSYDVLGGVQMQFDAATNTAGVQTFDFPGSKNHSSTTEANRGLKMTFDATISKLRGHATTAGTGTGQYDVFLRDNGANTNVKFNVPTSYSVNTLQKDTTNTHETHVDDILTLGFTPLGSVSGLYVAAYTMTPAAA